MRGDCRHEEQQNSQPQHGHVRRDEGRVELDRRRCEVADDLERDHEEGEDQREPLRGERLLSSHLFLPLGHSCRSGHVLVVSIDDAEHAGKAVDQVEKPPVRDGDVQGHDHRDGQQVAEAHPVRPVNWFTQVLRLDQLVERLSGDQHMEQTANANHEHQGGDGPSEDLGEVLPDDEDWRSSERKPAAAGTDGGTKAGRHAGSFDIVVWEALGEVSGEDDGAGRLSGQTTEHGAADDDESYAAESLERAQDGVDVPHSDTCCGHDAEDREGFLVGDMDVSDAADPDPFRDQQDGRDSDAGEFTLRADKVHQAQEDVGRPPSWLSAPEDGERKPCV